MGTWEKSVEPFDIGIYRQIVREGFVLTQGEFALSFDNHPFDDLKLNFPSFQLLRVHRNHPIRISDGGRVIIMPSGDKRLPGQVLRDKNPYVYDSASFFLAPYEIQLPENFPGELLQTLDGFVTSDGKRNLASLVYIPGRELGIDGDHARTASVVIPPQIPKHLNYWLYHAGRAQGYDAKATFGEGWKEIGRFDLKNTQEATYTAAKKLEQRFKTRIMTERRL